MLFGAIVLATVDGCSCNCGCGVEVYRTRLSLLFDIIPLPYVLSVLYGTTADGLIPVIPSFPSCAILVLALVDAR